MFRNLKIGRSTVGVGRIFHGQPLPAWRTRTSRSPGVTMRAYRVIGRFGLIVVTQS